MYIALIIIHVIVCIFLIGTILLQAGRGGGLTEMFGGGEAMQSVLGTRAPVVLKKATTVGAIAFLLTSLLLGMVTARRGRSLFERARFPVAPVTSPQEKSPPVSPQAELPGKETAPAETAPQPEEVQSAPESQ